MPRRFRKNPEVQIVIVPGHGRVYDVDVLEGDQYAQYAPHLLWEVGINPAASLRASSTVVAEPHFSDLLRDELTLAERETVPIETEPATMASAASSSTPDSPTKRKPGRPKKVQPPSPTT